MRRISRHDRGADHLDVMDRHDVGMRQPRKRLGLAEQPLARGAIAGLHQLERDPAIEIGVIRGIDPAHPAAADALEDVEPANGDRVGGLIERTVDLERHGDRSPK
jgi:hypothetical protein